MKNTSKLLLALTLAGTTLLAISAIGQKQNPVFYMAGDSTMANGRDAVKSPARGWAQMFNECFDGIQVENRAGAGQSSKSFRQPGKDRWTPIMQAVQPGDFVFIEFGHNDPKPDTVRNTTPEIYAANLERYIAEVREKQAIPVLLTPIVRRTFNRDGVSLRNTHGEYLTKCFEVAKKTKVDFIDLNTLTHKLITSYPAEETKKFFMWLEPGQWQLHPKGNRDDTHLNILGGRVVAAIAARELIQLHPELAPRLRSVETLCSENPEFAAVKEAIDKVYSRK